MEPLKEALSMDILFEICKQLVLVPGGIEINSHAPIDCPPGGYREADLHRSQNLVRRDTQLLRSRLALAYTCKALYRYGFRLYYSENLFKFADWISFERFYAGLDSRPWTTIRYIQVGFGTGPTPGDLDFLFCSRVLGAFAFKPMTLLRSIRTEYPCDIHNKSSPPNPFEMLPHMRMKYGLLHMIETLEAHNVESLMELEFYCLQCEKIYVWTRCRHAGQSNWTQAKGGNVKACNGVCDDRPGA